MAAKRQYEKKTGGPYVFASDYDALYTLLKRCHDDPGVAYTEAEQASQIQLWKDVAAYFESDRGAAGG